MPKLIKSQENWLCLFRDYKYFEPNFVDKLKLKVKRLINYDFVKQQIF
jgi:hypothetical protein